MTKQVKSVSRLAQTSSDQTMLEGSKLQVVWPVPEAAGTVFNTPDDGCSDTRNMLCSIAVNKYLHTVESVGFLFT